jgi:hypothetical protein
MYWINSEVIARSPKLTRQLRPSKYSCESSIEFFSVIAEYFPVRLLCRESHLLRYVSVQHICHFESGEVKLPVGTPNRHLNFDGPTNPFTSISVV